MSGTIIHTHEGILGCNVCLIYSAILAWIFLRYFLGALLAVNGKQINKYYGNFG